MIDQLIASLDLIILQTKLNADVLTQLMIVLWSVFIAIQLSGKRLLLLGIMPRKVYGLPGILFAPLLHADFNHLFFNSIPLLVLSNFLLLHGINYYLYVTLSITFISGGLIWCFGKPGLHIGASAVITGFWAILVSDIYREGTLTAIILGVICLYYFAGIFFGIFPSQKGVSWEGHLFGLVGGFVTGYFVH